MDIFRSTSETTESSIMSDEQVGNLVFFHLPRYEKKKKKARIPGERVDGEDGPSPGSVSLCFYYNS